MRKSIVRGVKGVKVLAVTARALLRPMCFGDRELCSDG
jgi:hypothetical protein